MMNIAELFSSQQLCFVNSYQLSHLKRELGFESRCRIRSTMRNLISSWLKLNINEWLKKWYNCDNMSMHYSIPKWMCVSVFIFYFYYYFFLNFSSSRLGRIDSITFCFWIKKITQVGGKKGGGVFKWRNRLAYEVLFFFLINLWFE